jgi:hypothetical protein
MALPLNYKFNVGVRKVLDDFRRDVALGKNSTRLKEMKYKKYFKESVYGSSGGTQSSQQKPEEISTMMPNDTIFYENSPPGVPKSAYLGKGPVMNLPKDTVKRGNSQPPEQKSGFEKIIKFSHPPDKIDESDNLQLKPDIAKRINLVEKYVGNHKLTIKDYNILVDTIRTGNTSDAIEALNIFYHIVQMRKSNDTITIANSVMPIVIGRIIRLNSQSIIEKETSDITDKILSLSKSDIRLPAIIETSEGKQVNIITAAIETNNLDLYKQIETLMIENKTFQLPQGSMSVVTSAAIRQNKSSMFNHFSQEHPELLLEVANGTTPLITALTTEIPESNINTLPVAGTQKDTKADIRKTVCSQIISTIKQLKKGGTNIEEYLSYKDKNSITAVEYSFRLIDQVTKPLATTIMDLLPAEAKNLNLLMSAVKATNDSAVKGLISILGDKIVHSNIVPFLEAIPTTHWINLEQYREQLLPNAEPPIMKSLEMLYCSMAHFAEKELEIKRIVAIIKAFVNAADPSNKPAAIVMAKKVLSGIIERYVNPAKEWKMKNIDPLEGKSAYEIGGGPEQQYLMLTKNISKVRLNLSTIENELNNLLASLG